MIRVAAAASMQITRDNGSRQTIRVVAAAASIQITQVAALAALLGLRRVGWIVACPPREDGFVLSGDEVITAAIEQLEAADGVQETPFVTVRVTVNEAGEANFEAYQVSLQCMAMVAEGALAPDPDDGASCLVPRPALGKH